MFRRRFAVPVLNRCVLPSTLRSVVQAPRSNVLQCSMNKKTSVQPTGTISFCLIWHPHEFHLLPITGSVERFKVNIVLNVEFIIY